MSINWATLCKGLYVVFHMEIGENEDAYLIGCYEKGNEVWMSKNITEAILSVFKSQLSCLQLIWPWASII